MKESIMNYRLFGYPIKLIGGLLAILIFMAGDGIEQAFLSKYIVDLGFSLDQSALVFSVYGITLAIASWLAGVLAEIWGPRRVMLLGLIIWVVFELIFLFGLEHVHFTTILVAYGIRGFGYPLFAFAFIVWVAYITEEQKLATAMGWFFFMFSGGIGFLGSFYPSITLPILGYMGTLWTSLIWIIIGGVIGIFCVDDKDKDGNLIGKTEKNDPSLKSFTKGITILWENPKVAAGGLLRTINTCAWFGYVVILPVFFTSTLNFETTEWLLIWSLASLSNMVCNVIWGNIGDRIGWLFVVKWFGCIGSAVTSVLFYYVPLAFGNNFFVAAVIAILFGAAIAAFTPLSAIMPTLAPDNKGSAMSILNLGAGLSSFVGPVIVGIANSLFGMQGVAWAFGMIYLASFGLTLYLKTDAKEQTDSVEEESIATL